MHSVDFEEVVRMQKSGDWEAAGALLAASATKLEGAVRGAFAGGHERRARLPAIERATAMPLPHVVDASSTAIREQGLQGGGLLEHNLRRPGDGSTEHMAARSRAIDEQDWNRRGDYVHAPTPRRSSLRTNC